MYWKIKCAHGRFEAWTVRQFLCATARVCLWRNSDMRRWIFSMCWRQEVCQGSVPMRRSRPLCRWIRRSRRRMQWAQLTSSELQSWLQHIIALQFIWRITIMAGSAQVSGLVLRLCGTVYPVGVCTTGKLAEGVRTPGILVRRVCGARSLTNMSWFHWPKFTSRHVLCARLNM